MTIIYEIYNAHFLYVCIGIAHIKGTLYIQN